VEAYWYGDDASLALLWWHTDMDITSREGRKILKAQEHVYSVPI
jgi:hypothetical protein